MELKFDEKGLIPAIVVDDETGKVLTLAFEVIVYVNVRFMKASRGSYKSYHIT